MAYPSNLAHAKIGDAEPKPDPAHVRITGHSFGAVTTQAVSGQIFPGQISFFESRIKAAIPMSPSSPKQESQTESAFKNVRIPWLLMTGTQDSSPIGGSTPESRRKVFPALSPGDKYQLVLDKAEHSVFTESKLPGEKLARNPNHHRAILAISTAFWDAYLKKNAQALKWLNSNGPRSVLESADIWQKK